MFDLILNSAALGIGLAMDAFSVSLTNGLAEPCGTRRRALSIAGIFALFQGVMPLLGWILVTTMAQQFKILNRFIPYIALGLLLFIGGKMLIEGIGETLEKRKAQKNGSVSPLVCVMVRTTLCTLLVQGVATSIDALSVGLQIVGYLWWEALLSALIIAIITFVICFVGVLIGRKFGTKLAEKATILGGVILIAIGVKIFLDGILA